MALYYVNKNQQANGDHEVHVIGCLKMPDQQNQIYLGKFPNCRPAVTEAKKQYPTANGCYLCSRECHTS